MILDDDSDFVRLINDLERCFFCIRCLNFDILEEEDGIVSDEFNDEVNDDEVSDVFFDEDSDVFYDEISFLYLVSGWFFE